MECHLEQVLYRDQRTIKTRLMDISRQDHRPYLRCQSNHQKLPSSSLESQRFHRLLSQNHLQDSSCVSDDAFRIYGDASISNSSLDIYNNCHNQYFLKNKRLQHRTDNEYQCENVTSFSGISEGSRRRGHSSWVKKLQNVLLLSTYLSLLTLANTHALPTTKMCNRPSDKTTGFWVSPCGSDFEPSGEPPKEMNVTSVNVAINSATSALISARYLKDKFRNQTIDSMGSDPEILYATVPPYSWLPQLPKFSSDEEFQQHLSSLQLQWQKTLLTLFKHLQTISVPLEQLILDFNRDPYEPLRGNFSQMEGLILNVLCELHDSIVDNNLKVREKITRDVMPDDLRNYCDKKTQRNWRDWIILRELVNVLEYTVSVCKYLAEGRTDGNHA